MVVVDDDIALPDLPQPRGVAGTLFVHKIAGALAESGKSLAEVAQAARSVIARVASIGMSLDTCTVPGSPKEDRIAAGMAELGLGIHGEPGVEQVAFANAAEAMATVVDKLKTAAGSGAKVCLLNNLGSTTPLEMSVLEDELTALASPVNLAAWPGQNPVSEAAVTPLPDGLTPIEPIPSADPQTRATLDNVADLLIQVGGAHVGDRTMIDALSPALDALPNGIAAAAAAARTGADSTANIHRAKAGRAAYVPEENLKGHNDPKPRHQEISKPTVNDIARVAGVSLATVDRVLNGRSGVRSLTIAKVNKAIDELGYVRDTAAANLGSTGWRSWRGKRRWCGMRSRTCENAACRLCLWCLINPIPIATTSSASTTWRRVARPARCSDASPAGARARRWSSSPPASLAT